jgi:hypothetical protein
VVAQDQRVNFDKVTCGANSNIHSTTYKIGHRFLTLILTVVGSEQMKALLDSRLASNGGVHLVPIDGGWSHQPLLIMRDLQSRLVAIEVC